MTAAEALTAAQLKAEAELLPLLQALHAALLTGTAPPERLLQALSLAAARQAYTPAVEALSETLASLIQVRTLPQQAQAVAVQLSISKGDFFASRAAEVLAGRSEAFVSPYARLAAQVLIWDSHREGAAAGAEQGGATRKQFVRVRAVKEQRAHSAYEGTFRPINGTWLMGGIKAQGPGDPALPMSERIWCGHITAYSR